MRLSGKIACVTGAAHGMGAATAKLFAKNGAAVVFTDIADDLGEQVAQEIRADGGDATYIHADAASASDWRMLIGSIMERHGRLDILVNNAAISGSAVDHMDELEGWQKLIDVNATSVYMGTRAASDVMVAAGRGSIVNICSIFSMLGFSNANPGYYACKGAVRAYTKTMAVRLGSKGVRVNLIHPGFFPTMRTATNAHVKSPAAAVTPLGRIGEHDDIAYGALYLASDEASFVTGADIVIDGGYSAQ